MASFSYQQHHPFLLDPVFLQPHTPIKMSGFSEEPNTTTTTTCFSHFYPLDQSLHPIPVDVSSNNKPSVTNIKHSTDSSSVVDNPESTGEQVSQKVMTTTMDKKRKSRDGSSMTSAQSKHAREVKGKKQNKCKSVMKDDDVDEEKKPKADHKKDMKKKKKEVPEEAPTGYIHVRARRGQATDSHSLAERVRREKISERMKLLQALVPGCDKVSGKALMLDEIINYVQSLQNQVEFLSMKLASVNPMFYDFGMDLDAFMVTPDQRLDGLVLSSPLPNVQQGKPPQASTAFSDATTSFTTPNSSYPLLFQQGHRPNTLPHQDNGQLLWDVDDLRQKLVNQSGFSNNLCSFH